MAHLYKNSYSKRRALFTAFAVTMLAAPVFAFSAELPSSVTMALKEAGIPLQNVAVVVQDVNSAPPLLWHNVRQAMNPASTMKLVTTYAALELLGPAFTWKTEALSDTSPLNGQINGKLYLRGSGDPGFSQEQLWLLLHQLRARGLTHINGELILDRSAFDLPPHDPADFDNKPLRPYNTGPDALMLNLNSLSLTLQPNTALNSVEVIVETPNNGLHLSNRLKLKNESCGDWREKFSVSVVGEAIELYGDFPSGCGTKPLHLSPWPANVQMNRLFRTVWQEVGGSLNGKTQEGRTPENAISLAVHESPPLGEIVRKINKYSNNVMARQLFLTLDNARPATPDGARRRIDTWLSEKELELPSLEIDNGSGLSRRARISAEGLARLLLAAWKSPVMPELMASLPLAGVDGTLKKRLVNGAATGRAHLKTGYLEGVRAIAGYVLDSHGKRWVVVFLINDPHSQRGKPAMDALLSWVAEH